MWGVRGLGKMKRGCRSCCRGESRLETFTWSPPTSREGYADAGGESSLRVTLMPVGSPQNYIPPLPSYHSPNPSSQTTNLFFKLRVHFLQELLLPPAGATSRSRPSSSSPNKWSRHSPAVVSPNTSREFSCTLLTSIELKKLWSEAAAAPRPSPAVVENANAKLSSPSSPSTRRSASALITIARSVERGIRLFDCINNFSRSATESDCQPGCCSSPRKPTIRQTGSYTGASAALPRTAKWRSSTFPLALTGEV